MAVFTEFRIRGLKSVRYVAAQIPKTLPESAFLPALLDLARLGEETMRDYIMRHTGEKATGRLADSVQGLVTPTGEGGWKVQVGSNLEHALYRARGVPAIQNFNKRVEVLPGKWRFIRNKPEMQPMNFLDYTAGIMERALTRLFSKEIGMVTRVVDEEQRSLSLEEERHP